MDRKALIRKICPLIASGLSLVAILFLFAPILTLKQKIDGEKIYTSLNMIDFFNPSYTRSWIIISLIVLIGVGAIVALVGFFIKDKKIKDGLMIAGVFINAIVACFLISLREIFANFGSSIIDNYSDVSVAWGLPVTLAFLVIGIGFLFAATEYGENTTTRGLVEDAILIALAFVLNFIKIPLQVEGSVNFQMLPLMIIALRRGPLNGFIASGIIYGLLTCLTDGYGFATYPFDYLIGFGSTAIIGFFRHFIMKEEGKLYDPIGILFIFIGGVLVTLVRLVGSTTSSMVIYDYEFVPALVYNVLYVTISGGIATAALIALYGPIQKINRLFPAK